MRKFSQRNFSHNINHCISIVYYIICRGAMHCAPTYLSIVHYQLLIVNINPVVIVQKLPFLRFYFLSLVSSVFRQQFSVFTLF